MKYEGYIGAVSSNGAMTVEPRMTGGEGCVVLTGDHLRVYRQHEQLCQQFEKRTAQEKESICKLVAAFRKTATETGSADTPADPNSNSSLKRRKLEAELRLVELQIREVEMRIARGAR